MWLVSSSIYFVCAFRFWRKAVVFLCKMPRNCFFIIVSLVWLSVIVLGDSNIEICNSSLLQSDTDSNTTTLGKTKYKWNIDAKQRCNIKRMTYDELYKLHPSGLPPLYHEPLIIYSNDYSKRLPSGCIIERFIQKTSLENITKNFPKDFMVTLSSSNSFSDHRRTITLKQYINETVSSEVMPRDLSNETWYLFGETYSDEWQKMLDDYCYPPCQTCTKELSALSFGIGGKGSGVQWHTHGPGFSQTLNGRKHWILYHPRDKPKYDTDYASRFWMEEVYTSLPESKKPYECTLHPGEMIYFPNHWHHAIINLDWYTSFVSTFTTEHNLELL